MSFFKAFIKQGAKEMGAKKKKKIGMIVEAPECDREQSHAWGKGGNGLRDHWLRRTRPAKKAGCLVWMN